jgi:hypothetical protein
MLSFGQWFEPMRTDMADHLVKLVHSRDLAEWDRFPARHQSHRLADQNRVRRRHLAAVGGRLLCRPLAHRGI